MKEHKKVAEINASPENRPGTGERAGNNGNVPPAQFRFKKGRSGNPGGRLKTKPIIDRIRAVLETPLPVKMRGDLETKFQFKLNPKLTFGDAFILKMVSEGYESGLPCCIAHLYTVPRLKKGIWEGSIWLVSRSLRTIWPARIQLPHFELNLLH